MRQYPIKFYGVNTVKNDTPYYCYLLSKPSVLTRGINKNSMPVTVVVKFFSAGVAVSRVEYALQYVARRWKALRPVPTRCGRGFG